MASHISCVGWVRRGIAQRHPTKYKLDEAEMQRAAEVIRAELAAVETPEEDDGADGWVDEDDDENDGGDSDDEDDDDKMDEDKPPTAPDDLSAYNLDDYDKETNTLAAGPFSNIKGLTYYNNANEDPYITLKEDDEDEERQELEIMPTDNLILTAKTEDDVSYLEVYVYDDSEEDLYVHHDLLLPAVPLCLEWLDFAPAGAPGRTAGDDARAGNYVAIGTMDPEIEIWSLDTLDAACPDAILGRPDETAAHVPVPLGTGKKKRKKTKARAPTAAHHVDAVLALSWNRTHRNLLASASADRSVKLWDLSRGADGGALRSFDVHRDTVQGVEWNQRAPTVLLSGSYDRTVRTFDSRSPDQGLGARIGADVEAVRWDPWEDHQFYVSLDNGIVLSFDARTLPSNADGPAPALWTLAAHDGAASALDVSPLLRGVLVTGGADKSVKVWNITSSDGGGGKQHVSPVISRDLGVGKVFSATWSPDDPLVLAAAGSKARLQVWDVAANGGARSVFAPKLAAAGRALRERERASGGVVGVQSDGEDESGEEDDCPHGYILNGVH